MVGGEPEVLPGLCFPSPLYEPTIRTWQTVAMVTAKLRLVGNRSRLEPKRGGGVAGAECQGSNRPSREQLVSNRLRLCCAVVCCNSSYLRVACSARQVDLAVSTVMLLNAPV